MKKEKPPLRGWYSFYEELLNELKEVLGEEYKQVWERRNKEIYLHYRSQIGHLNRVDMALITEALCKARGKPYKRYYKRTFKGQKEFAELVREQIE